MECLKAGDNFKKKLRVVISNIIIIKACLLLFNDILSMTTV